MTVDSATTVSHEKSGAEHEYASRVRWTAVCPYSRLTPDRGVAALVGGAQVAIIRTHEGQVYAVSHSDPVSGANVMSRGAVGLHNGRPTITSPAYRHVYDLVTGECLDLPGIRLPVYPVRSRGGLVEVGVYAARDNAFAPGRGVQRSPAR